MIIFDKRLYILFVSSPVSSYLFFFLKACRRVMFRTFTVCVSCLSFVRYLDMLCFSIVKIVTFILLFYLFVNLSILSSQFLLFHSFVIPFHSSFYSFVISLICHVIYLSCYPVYSIYFAILFIILMYMHK